MKQDGMIVKRVIVVLILFACFLVGCYTSKEAYSNFDRIVASLVGTPYEDAFLPVSGLFQGRKPSEVRVLENGNEMHVYRDYFDYLKSKAHKGGICDLYIEVNPVNKLVVAARSEGKGCWMPY